MHTFLKLAHPTRPAPPCPTAPAGQRALLGPHQELRVSEPASDAVACARARNEDVTPGVGMLSGGMALVCSWLRRALLAAGMLLFQGLLVPLSSHRSMCPAARGRSGNNPSHHLASTGWQTSAGSAFGSHACKSNKFLLLPKHESTENVWPLCMEAKRMPCLHRCWRQLPRQLPCKGVGSHASMQAPMQARTRSAPVLVSDKGLKRFGSSGGCKH